MGLQIHSCRSGSAPCRESARWRRNSRGIAGRRIAAALCVFSISAAAVAIRLSERPAEPGDWGYWPEANAVSPVNPPGFVWRPCKDAVAYHLQVAHDGTFARLVYEKADIRWSAHCPSRMFAPGEYFWRYAALDRLGGRTGWSKVRGFTIRDGAIAFPLPPTPELVKRMPAKHPRLFFRPEDLPRLRRLAKGTQKTPFAKLLQSANDLIAHPPDTSEPPLYSRGCERPEENWVNTWSGNQTRTRQLTDGAALLAFVYRLSGDKKFGRAARDLLLAFAKWDPGGSTNYRYNDEAAMHALYGPARAYSWAYPLLSKADRQAIAKVMRVRGQDCLDNLQISPHLWRPYNSHHNRSWHWLGEVAIAFHDEIPEADLWLDYAMTVQGTVFPVWGDEDGGWHEGTAYWGTYLDWFSQWADVMSSAFAIDAYSIPYFRHAGDFGMYLLPPGTQHGGFGDLTSTMRSQDIAALMARFAAHVGNPYWRWFAEAHSAGGAEGYVEFLRSSREMQVAAKAPTDLPCSIQFRKTGLAVLNTNLIAGGDNIQVQFKSSPFFGRQSHGYNSNNAFMLHIHGKPVLVSSGRRDVYGSPHHKNWMWQTRSENAILVNGEGQIKVPPHDRGELIAFHTSPALDIVSGEAGGSYSNLVSWKRRIVFFKPHGVLIHDVLRAPEPSRYQWLLHTRGATTIAGSRVSWAGEPGRVDLDFAYPPGLIITQTDQYDPPPAAWTKWDLGEWHLTAEPPRSAAQQEFVTFVAVDGAKAGIDPSRSILPRRVTVILPEGTAIVEFQETAIIVMLPGAPPGTIRESR